MNLNIKDKVKYYLEKDHKCRSNDRRLILQIWNDQLEGRWGNFFEKFRSGELADTESIRRSRQRWQETNPSLRGDNYLKRHKETKKVISELRAANWVSEDVILVEDELKGQGDMFPKS